MGDSSEKFIQWKKLWQLISGINLNTPSEIVLEKLREVSKELIDGVKETRTLDNTNNDIDPKHKKKLQPIINDLQHYFNMGEDRTWNLLCYYLVNEFRGSPNSLLNYHATEANMMTLMNDVWRYYTLERLVMLRIVRNVIEYHKSSDHPYCREYAIIVKELKLATIRKSYIDQLEYLIKAVTSVGLFGEQNAREIIEVLQIILLAIEADGVLPDEFKKLVELFKMHSFGRHQFGLNPLDHKEIITKIIYSEVAIFLMCADVQRLNNESTWTDETIKLLDDQIASFYQHPEHGPILLTWMLLCFNSPNVLEDDDNVAKYNRFGARAAHLGVFDYMCTMIRYPMYNDQHSIIGCNVRKTIYNHLTQMCQLFDSDGSMARHNKIFDLLSELLRTPAIAKDFIGREDGAMSLFNTACENFPVDFLSLTMIAESIAYSGSSQCSFIRQQLENLPIYAEIFDSDRYQLKPSPIAEDEFILIENYSPFQKIDYTIPAGTAVVISDRNNQTMIHFKTEVNYFNVLHNEINQLLASTLRYTEIVTIYQMNVEAGLKLLTWTVQRVRNAEKITSEMVHPTEMVFDILIKFRSAQHPPIVLLARCFDVCSVLVPLCANEIYDRIVKLNILPFVTNNNLDFHSYCNGLTFESGLVGHYLVNFEKNTGKYDFLLAYLNFLKAYSKLNLNNIMEVEVPSLIFMLREIFPHFLTWRFEKESDRQVIYSIVIQYLFEILEISADQLKNDEKKTLLRNICVYSLLTNNGLTLLRFLAVGNDHLQCIMMNDPNWMTSSQIGMNFFVQRSMTILMQILRLRSTVYKDDQLSPLESVIYTQPKQLDNLRIIPVVTSYMGNIFNNKLPLLACRLLRRFAIEFQMSLLACLDMEPDQIRLMFLQRLRDEMESDELKVNIIEFVEACINKQPGLTEAFFKISYESESRFLEKIPKTKDIADGILIYMSEYLETISENSDTIANKQLSGIMSLFHAIWKNNMQSLVQDLIVKPNFWLAITSPLHGSIDPDTRAYSQIFNILGIELFRCTAVCKMDENLRKAFENFLKPDVFNKWIKHVLTLPNETIEDHFIDETPEWLCRLQSFKDLIVMLVRKQEHVNLLTDRGKTDFAKECFDVLVERSYCSEDFRPFIILSEVYLIVLVSMDDTEELGLQTLDKMITLMNNLSSSYADIHTRAKESILALAFKTIDIVPVQQCGEKLTNLVRSIIDIVCLEIIQTEIKVLRNESSTSTNDTSNLSFILSINLLKKITMNFITEDVSDWTCNLISTKLFHRILSCLNITLPLYQQRRIVTEMLDFLIIFVKTDCSNELLHCDVANYLWLKLLPPKELLQFNNGTKGSNEWNTTDWWPIYARGIDLVLTMLRAHGYWFLKDAILFVGVQEEYLIDSILLAKQSLDAQAVILIKTSLELVCELLNFKKEWNLEHSQSMNNLMRCVQITMDHSVYLLHRPKILKQLMGKDVKLAHNTYLENLTPSDELIETMNNLIEIIVTCSKCMLVFSPKLLNLLTDSEFLVAQWQPLFEIQFNAPKLNSDSNNPQLSIGTILSVACLLTRVLSMQSFTFHEESLNDINQTNPEVTYDGTQTSCTTPATDRVTDRTQFNKSMSMTSTVLPSEILSNLDERICFTALEYVMTLLASQSLLALKDVNLSNREKQLIKRELSTELHIFHDWVKKTLRTDVLHRKKYGIQMHTTNLQSDRTGLAQKTAEKTSRTHRSSLHQDIMRKQHLTNQPNLSPITKNLSSTEVSTTQTISTSRLYTDSSSTPFVNVGTGLINYEEIETTSTAEQSIFTGLSTVKIVEEDYVHFLANYFTFICQSE